MKDLPNMTQAIDRDFIAVQPNSVLAWRLRFDSARPGWPLSTTGSLAALFVIAACAALMCAALYDGPRVSWIGGLLVFLGFWLANGLAVYPLLLSRRCFRTRELQRPGIHRRYLWHCHILIGGSLLTTFWCSASVGELNAALAVLLAAGLIAWLAVLAICVPLEGLRAVRSLPAGHGKSLADEFGSWEQLIDRLQTAGNRLEKEHTFLGVIAGTSQPFLIHDALANSHMVVLGATRSGKSSRALIPLAIQKIRRRKSVILYFDLKGSSTEFGALATACRDAQTNFRWCTTESSLSSYVFNPLSQAMWQSLSTNEQAQLLMASLSLDYGEATSGDAYFGGVAERVLAGALTVCPEAQSLRELYHVIMADEFRERIGMSKHDFDNSGALLSQLRRLAELRPFNWVSGDAGGPRVGEGAIQIAQLLRDPGVVYFRLPATVEPLSARTIPRLVIRLLVAAARRQGGAKCQIYVIIDEAQETMQRSLAPVLKQARDLRISVWMALQNLSDLEGAGAGLGDVVLGNTSVRIFFSASDLAARNYLPTASGEQRRVVFGRGETVTETDQGGINVGRSNGAQQLIAPRFGPDELNCLNAQEGLCVVEAAPKSGLTALNHPAFVRTPYFCKRTVYNAFARIPWPKPNEFTVVNEAGRSASPPADDPSAGAAGSAVPVGRPQAPGSSGVAAVSQPCPPTSQRNSPPNQEASTAGRMEQQQLALQLLKLADEPVS